MLVVASCGGSGGGQVRYEGACGETTYYNDLHPSYAHASRPTTCALVLGEANDGRRAAELSVVFRPNDQAAPTFVCSGEVSLQGDVYRSATPTCRLGVPPAYMNPPECYGRLLAEPLELSLSADESEVSIVGLRFTAMQRPSICDTTAPTTMVVRGRLPRARSGS